MAERRILPDTGPGGVPSRVHDFDEIYSAGTPPWDIGRPQSSFEELAEGGGFAGRVLDVGCGTGEHALLAASRGHEALGVDLSGRAIELATQKAESRGVAARFMVWDALQLSELAESFDTVLDCGLFHVFDDEDRDRYVRSLAAAVAAGGRYHMLCFSDRQLGDWGPRRVTEAEIRASFGPGWAIDSVEPAILEVTFDPAGVRAWRVTATRV